MKVCEIFASIQGESTYAGLPCVFVRMTGCNLRCTYCDTTYAYEEGVEMPEGEIIEKVASYGIHLVELTGGEPLLQSGAVGLAKSLLDKGYKVLIETNGSQDIAAVDGRAVIILDIKTPGSGMSEKMLLRNLEKLKITDEVKFVITSKADYEWSRGFVKEHSLADKCTVLLSPSFGMVEAAELSRWILKDRLRVRLNLQLHKYIFHPDRRGV